MRKPCKFCGFTGFLGTKCPRCQTENPPDASAINSNQRRQALRGRRQSAPDDVDANRRTDQE